MYTLLVPAPVMPVTVRAVESVYFSVDPLLMLPERLVTSLAPVVKSSVPPPWTTRLVALTPTPAVSLMPPPPFKVIVEPVAVTLPVIESVPAAPVASVIGLPPELVARTDRLLASV
jgi:hypothetical protein